MIALVAAVEDLIKGVNMNNLHKRHFAFWVAPASDHSAAVLQMAMSDDHLRELNETLPEPVQVLEEIIWTPGKGVPKVSVKTTIPP